MIRGAFVLLLAASAGGPALAQPAGAIGRVERVVVWGYGTAPGASARDLYERQPVVANDAVETVKDGALHLRFDDETRLRLGSQSKAVLDRFVYDPARGSGEMTIELGRGVFRFVSGRMDKRGYTLVTPTATIGVRGTDFIVEVLESGETVVSVLEGLVALRTRLLQLREIEVAAGEAGRTPADGGDPSKGARGGLGNPIGDPGLRDDAGRGGGGGGAGGSGEGMGGGGGRGN